MRLLLLFLPYLISLLYVDNPEVLYWICWGGSFWIFFATFTGLSSPLPKDRSFWGQFMRPFIFAHLLCAGYMCLTSVFYFMHYHGYFYFEQIDVPDPVKIAKTAQCQQYYLLAHTALATGLTISMKGFERPRFWAFPQVQNSNIFLRLTIITFLIYQGLSFVPFGSAFKYNLSQLSLLASLLFLVQALSEKKNQWLAFGLFATNLFIGALSGMKSATLIIILFLGAQYFERYRWRTFLFGSLALWLWFSFIPTISVFIRKQSWFGAQTSTTALRNAINELQANKVDTRKLNWDLLVYRSSEVGMFLRYTDYVPSNRPFYGFQIVDQALMGLIPKGFRPDGRSIDETAMARAIEVGIVDRNVTRTTSAKPALVADAYMSGAELGIVVTFFLFGFFATHLAKTCERLFGGYSLGCVLIFNGCFSIFQTGNCFENIPSSVFYGVITMYFLFYLLLELRILQRVGSQPLPSLNV